MFMKMLVWFYSFVFFNHFSSIEYIFFDIAIDYGLIIDEVILLSTIYIYHLSVIFQRASIL